MFCKGNGALSEVAVSEESLHHFCYVYPLASLSLSDKTANISTQLGKSDSQIYSVRQPWVVAGVCF